MAATALLCSCGSANKAAQGPFKDNEDIFMKPKDEVDVGYGNVKKDRLAYSVSDVKLDKNEISGYSNIWDYLRGKVPGVQIGYASAGSTPDIQIRGVNSINSSTQPLIVVDGMETSDISYLSPNEISSVSVLKDASSSIYGSRGANGVILITTKTAARAAQEAAEMRRAAKSAEKAARSEAKAERKASKRK